MNWLLLCATKPERGFLSPCFKFSRLKNDRGLNLFEAKGPQGKPIYLLQTGLGPLRAETQFDLFRKYKPDIRNVIHYGLSGGLSQQLKSGDLIFPTDFICEGKPTLHQKPEHIKEWEQNLTKGGISFLKGGLLTSSVVLETPKDKEQAGLEYQAIAVDMETYPIAQICFKDNIRYYSIRAIFDPLEWDLSALQKIECMNVEGNFNSKKMVKNIIPAAKLLFSMPQYQKALSKAGKALARAIFGITQKFMK